MTAPLVIGSSQGNLGDNVLITPIFKAIPGCTVRLFDDPSCRSVAPLFDGLVDHVEFCANPGTPPTVDEPRHKSQRMLNALGITHVSCIPRVIVTEAEEAWARTFLAQFGPLESLLVIIANNSGWRDPENWLAQSIKPPKEMMETFARVAGQHGYHPLQFGVAEPADPAKDPFDPLEYATTIRGLTVRETAACYKLIGRMVTCDTGDHCLMVAVGGRISMVTPPELEGFYRHYDVRYTPDLWRDEPVRARYHEFKDWQKVIEEDLGFNW